MIREDAWLLVFVAVDPSAKSLTCCGLGGKPLHFNQKVKEDPTQ